jgi:hypothetical protein
MQILQKVYWGCWIVGVILILLSRQGIIATEVGWAGFYLACGVAIISRIRWPARRAPTTAPALENLYVLFIETLQKCSRRSGITELPDDELERALFIDCAAGVHSCLPENSLAALRDAGYIDDEASALATELLEKWTSLERTTWSAEAVRHDPAWQQFFGMCDRLLRAAHAELAAE